MKIATTPQQSLHSISFNKLQNYIIDHEDSINEGLHNEHSNEN